MKRSKWLTVVMYIFFGAVLFMAIAPFLVVVIMSVSTETDIGNYGFSLIPKHFTLAAYKELLRAPGQLLRSALFTFFLGATVPAVACVLNSMAAYPLSVDGWKFKGIFNKYLIYTMLFSGGGLASYIINTQYYHLYDSPLIFFAGGGVSAWGIFLYRTFFKDVPRELIDAAKIDGAGEFRILWEIMLPMAKSIFAMQYTLGFIGQWNSLDTSMYYISNPKYYQLQYYMKLILDDITMLKQSMAEYGLGQEFPSVTIQYAVLVFSLIPIFILFPYMQKFFTKGMAAAAVKG